MASDSTSDNLKSLTYNNDGGKPCLSVLDQLLIPKEKVYLPIPDVQAAWGVIRSMQIRGAPLIAIVAVLGLSVDLNSNVKTIKDLSDCTTVKEVKDLVQAKMDYLRTSRPTAVNLFNALDELSKVVEEAVKENVTDATSASTLISKAVSDHAEFMLERDVSDNKLIGSHGADALLEEKSKKTKKRKHVEKDGDSSILDEKTKKRKHDEKDGDSSIGKGIRLVTICNTGSLATAGYGTALGVARALHGRNLLESIHALETRPYNQGSRLTAFEMVEEKMPNATLICDSSAAALMQSSTIDACVVGADRVCANGDVANKIGTYQLATVANAHNVSFYVASPFTTLDANLAHGGLIEIEERPMIEMIESAGAPENVKVWNPAFDVTPARLITGIITEKGVIFKGEDEKFDIAGFIEKHS